MPNLMHSKEEAPTQNVSFLISGKLDLHQICSIIVVIYHYADFLGNIFSSLSVKLSQFVEYQDKKFQHLQDFRVLCPVLVILTIIVD